MLIGTGTPESLSASRLLAEPEARKQLGKLMLADEWAESLRQSHPGSEQRAACLEAFWHEVQFLKEQFGRVVPGGNVMAWLQRELQGHQHSEYNWL